MANPEHVKIVKQGEEAIWKWRRKHRDETMDLREADLTGASLTAANLSNANLLYTVFTDVDLSKTKGLETVNHVGRSHIAIDTIIKSKGRIPRAFLEGCGVPQAWLDYITSLTADTSLFFSVFISYAEADDAFSVKLHRSLLDREIRCWRWKEDATMGQELMAEVQKGIDERDRIIVICSENSLDRPAVIEEIQRGMEKEHKNKLAGIDNQVLFPIRIDDHVFQWKHHLRSNLTRKVIGDFRNHADPKAYERELERLITALRRPAVEASAPTGND